METRKSEIHKLIDSIKHSSVLQMVAEDIQYYTRETDIPDELNYEQLKELDKAIEEADNDDTVDWNDFKKEMSEWKKR